MSATVYKPLPHLKEARSSITPSARLHALQKQTPYLRGHLLGEGKALGVKTFDLVTIPYPASMGFSGATSVPTPYLMFTNRMNVVQYIDHDGEKRTLLFNPTNYEASARTPFFNRLAQKYGDFLSNKVMSKRHTTVPQALQSLGLTPEDIDYISFDHLHTQDLRDSMANWFPRAKLLIQRIEWEMSQDLHPMQNDWFIAEGTRGIPLERVVTFEGDVSLGRGVALIHTPGHTYGNHSLAVCVGGSSIYTISENGVSADSYAPLRSKIPGVTNYARSTGQDLILNGNTRELSLDQYNSMMVEKILSGPSPVDPDFCNHIPSSEMIASPLAPFLAPTFFHGPLMAGEISSLKNGVAHKSTPVSPG
jgi:glyoxylase-like metal-dependent hydrolase (beta-lactamase superfamily II)